MTLCKRCGLWNGPCGIHHGEKPSPVIIYRRRFGLSRWKCTARQASVVRLVMAAGVTPVAELSTMDSAGCRRSVRTFASLRKTSSAAQTGLYDVKHVPSVVRCTSTRQSMESTQHNANNGKDFRRRQSSQTRCPGEHGDVDARPANHLATPTSPTTLAPFGLSHRPGLSSVRTAEDVPNHTVASGKQL